MRVQAVIQQESGITYHRLINPFTYMPWEPQDMTGIIWEGDVNAKIDCDILIYNKFTYIPVERLKDLQSKGMKIVVDIDDYWYLPVTHINYRAWQETGHSKKIEEHIIMADLVICTSMLLQDKVRSLNKNTTVIPNTLPFGREKYLPLPIPHEKMTFMYMGGSTHLPDVELLRGKFKRIGSDPFIKGNAEFVLAGYNKSQQKQFYTPADMKADNNNYVISDAPWGNYDKMDTIFSYTGSHRTLPTANLDDYLNYYDQADVALVPLVDSHWNSYKSTLKIVEAGAKGVPVICSKVEPYYPELKTYPGIMWVTDNNWLEHIKWCIQNPVKAIDMGRALQERVQKDYDLTTWNIIRYELFKKLLS